MGCHDDLDLELLGQIVKDAAEFGLGRRVKEALGLFDNDYGRKLARRGLRVAELIRTEERHQNESAIFRAASPIV